MNEVIIELLSVGGLESTIAAAALADMLDEFNAAREALDCWLGK